ncbi:MULTISPECIES: hypothetical protein [unclassified Microcoleus]|uniref:hypothetical protein n=1 Tax=unclassified Microcoleus TaxID=2642155 RepID=UPI002FCF27B2
MGIRILPKNHQFREPEPEPVKSSESGFDVDLVFRKLTAKVRWEKEHIKPVLGELFSSYDDRCFIFLTFECDKGYVGKGYGFYHSRTADYDEIGRRLAQLWPIEEETEERKVNHYSRGARA